MSDLPPVSEVWAATPEDPTTWARQTAGPVLDQINTWLASLRDEGAPGVDRYEWFEDDRLGEGVQAAFIFNGRAVRTSDGEAAPLLVDEERLPVGKLYSWAPGSHWVDQGDQTAAWLCFIDGEGNLRRGTTPYTIEAARQELEWWSANMSEDAKLTPEEHDAARAAMFAEWAEEDRRYAEEQRAMCEAWRLENDGGAGVEVAPVPIAAPVDASDLPDEFTRPPGLVGEITDWIVSSARRPQRALALGAALSLVGTAAGRKFGGPTRSGTHLYVLALAPTGAGKAHARQASLQLLNRAGLNFMIGPPQFMSMSGLIQFVARKPLSLCFMDEFGAYLERINGKNANGHEKGISGVLREIWGSSFDVFVPPVWADSSGRGELPTVYAPALSLYGMSVHSEFYEALQGQDVSNGFLNRFLIVSTHNDPAEVDEPAADVFAPPEHLLDQLRAIAGVGGPYAAATMHNEVADAPPVVVPWATPAANRVRLDLLQHVRQRSKESPLAENLMKRTVETTIRLATIVAIGRDGERAAVTVGDMEWARDYALWSAESMIRDAGDYMVGSENQRRARSVLRILRDAGDWMSRTDLMKKIDHLFDSKTLSNVLEGLEQAGQIEGKKLLPPSGGRPATFWKAVI